VGEGAGYEKGWGRYLADVVAGDNLITLRVSALDIENGNAPCQVALGIRDNVVAHRKHVSPRRPVRNDRAPHSQKIKPSVRHR
jgi:hypothetical protein